MTRSGLDELNLDVGGCWEVMNENMAKQYMDEIFSWFYVSYLFMLPFIQFHNEQE